jgi:hypothetical protein
MNAKAVPHADVKVRSGLFALVAMAAVGLIAVALAGTAVAAPIGTNGKISACYKAKGKAKGAMRVVPANKKCRKGERKLAWNVAGPAGAAGPSGPSGSTGSNGSAGSNGATGGQGTTGNEAALQAKIADLTLKVEGLEGVLDGLTNGDLTGAVNKLTGLTGTDLTDVVGKLDGITGLQLTNAVGAVPAVTALCAQANALPGQINSSLSSALSGLSLEGVIPLGLVLKVPNLTSVPAFTC